MMKNLYKVFMIDTKGEILLNEYSIGENEEEAKFNADCYLSLDNMALTLDDVTIVVSQISDGIRIEKSKKEE